MRVKKNYRLIYEMNYGSIPKGYHIHHKDGNRKNNDPRNLEAISPLQHLRLHVDNGDFGAANLLAGQLKISLDEPYEVLLDEQAFKERKAAARRAQCARWAMWASMRQRRKRV